MFSATAALETLTRQASGELPDAAYSSVYCPAPAEAAAEQLLLQQPLAEDLSESSDKSGGAAEPAWQLGVELCNEEDPSHTVIRHVRAAQVLHG